MFVKNLMLSLDNLVTVSPEDNISTALKVIDDNNFLSIPVAIGNRFYGTISKDRIYAFYYEKSIDKKCLLTDFLVENVMRTDIPTIQLGDAMEKAAHFLEVKNVPFVAVMDDDKFKGIVTHHAIFHEFTEVFGLNKGKRIAIIAYDIPGQISKLSNIITENKGDIISFVVLDPKSVTEIKEIVLRIRTENYEDIITKIAAAGFKIQ